MSYSEPTEHLNLHSLRGRRICGDLTETYKLFNGLVDIQWDHIFTASQYSNRNTKKVDGKILIAHCNLNLGNHSYSNRIAVLWNNLFTITMCAFY